MWCRTRDGVLVNLEQCRIIDIEEVQEDGGEQLRLVAHIDPSTTIVLDSQDLAKMPRAEALHEIEIIRDQVFRALSNGARFYRVDAAG